MVSLIKRQEKSPGVTKRDGGQRMRVNEKKKKVRDREKSLESLSCPDLDLEEPHRGRIPFSNHSPLDLLFHYTPFRSFVNISFSAAGMI